MAIPLGRRRNTIRVALAEARYAGRISAREGDYLALRAALDREAGLLNELIKLIDYDDKKAAKKLVTSVGR